MKNNYINDIQTALRILEKAHRPTMLELLGNYTPFQILVMALLSARTKDSMTIPIVKEMFRKYPRPEDYAQLTVEEIEKLIYPVGFYRIKAKNIKKLSRIIIDKYHCKIPETFDELISLPGVGRKTANCVLNYAFNKPAIAVDIHVHRLANRLGWVATKTPEQTEEELKKIIPRGEWINVNKLLVGHGQTTCRPVKPKCGLCSIENHCRYKLKNLSKLATKII